MSLLISKATDEQLLAELISRHEPTQAPWREIRDPDQFRAVLIGIGKNESVNIVLSLEALKELETK